MDGSKPGLGKGLSALMADNYSHIADGVPPENTSAITKLPITALTSGTYQPRKFFDDAYLQELSLSIKENGVMQPIIVRKLVTRRNGADYEIVAGERRWRASKLAGLQHVPIIIKELDDAKALEIALIENIQRQDLSIVEEAEGYQQLMKQFSYTQEVLAKMVGKSRSHVANTLRMTSLPDEIKQHVQEGALSFGHARALLGHENAIILANHIIKEGLTVRQTEALAKDASTKEQKKPSTAMGKKSLPQIGSGSKDPDIIALEETLSSQLQIKVIIDSNGSNGTLSLRYTSLEQLDGILRLLGGAI